MLHRGIFAILIVFVLLWMVNVSAQEAEKAEADASYSLISRRQDGDVDLVAKQIDIAGKLVVQLDPKTGESISNPARDAKNAENAENAKNAEEAENAGNTKNAEKKAEPKIQRIPIKVSSKQEYEEVRIAQGNFAQGETARSTLGAWYFLQDATTIQVGETEEKPQLDKNLPLVGVDVREGTVQFFRPNGLLTREEKDLIDLQANTLLLDALLPNRNGMKVGDTWKLSPDVMALLLQLDLVFQLDMKGTFSEVKKGIAILSISGWMEGSSDGTSSKIDVEGKVYFDLKRGRILWIGLVVRENRSAGYVAPGMEVVARLQYRIKPQEQAKHLTEKTLASLTFDEKQYGVLRFVDPGKRWECQMDSHWFATTWNEKQATFRLVKGGNLIAQCSIAVPQDGQASLKMSIDDFAQNIRKTLGAGFGEILEQKNSLLDDGTEIYRIDVAGKVDELALRWVYYLITKRGENPKQETVVFTVEEKLLPDFGTSDQQIIDTFQWH